MARPLTKKDRSGVLYARSRAVETAIDLAIQQTHEVVRQRAWLSDQTDPGFLLLECLVYFIRDAWRRGDDPAMNALMPPLLARCERMLKAKIPDSTHLNAADIRENIISEFSLLFIEDGNDGHTAELDYYECCFNRAFKCFRIDHIRRETKRSSHFEQFPEQDSPSHSLDEMPARQLPEKYGTPAIQLGSLFRKERLAAINNLPPDQRKAVFLCGVLGLKEESEDPTVITAATLCGVTGRTIRNRLTRAAATLSKFKGDA
jgi:hypothetical protein